MPDTTRRVNVTFTFATDVDADHVMRQALESLPDHVSAGLEHVHVHEFDLTEEDDTEPSVQLVVDPHGGITGAWVDNPDRADEFARNTSGVVVVLPIEADHR